MIIYNVTVKVDWSIHDEWLHWMKDEQIPLVLKTQYFKRYQLVRLLQVDDSDGPTYAVQYYAESLEDCNDYIQEFGASQQRKSIEKWGNLFVDFSTLMEVVH